MVLAIATQWLLHVLVPIATEANSAPRNGQEVALLVPFSVDRYSPAPFRNQIKKCREINCISCVDPCTRYVNGQMNEHAAALVLHCLVLSCPCRWAPAGETTPARHAWPGFH
jgi:hypothetical protein